jgi:hypothetical protein
MMRIRVCALVAVAVCAVILLSSIVSGQLTDKTLAPNTAGSGINKSLAEEIGAGRGDVLTHNSSNHQPRSIPLHSARATTFPKNLLGWRGMDRSLVTSKARSTQF